MVTLSPFLMVFFTFALATASARSLASRFTVPVPISATGVGLGFGVGLGVGLGDGVGVAVGSGVGVGVLVRIIGSGVAVTSGVAVGSAVAITGAGVSISKSPVSSYPVSSGTGSFASSPPMSGVAKPALQSLSGVVYVSPPLTVGSSVALPTGPKTIGAGFVVCSGIMFTDSLGFTPSFAFRLLVMTARTTTSAIKITTSSTITPPRIFTVPPALPPPFLAPFFTLEAAYSSS